MRYKNCIKLYKDEFMYLGDGVWNGENKNYPIYAWMDCAVEVPLPPRKENK